MFSFTCAKLSKLRLKSEKDNISNCLCKFGDVSNPKRNNMMNFSIINLLNTIICLSFLYQCVYFCCPNTEILTKQTKYLLQRGSYNSFWNLPIRLTYFMTLKNVEASNLALGTTLCMKYPPRVYRNNHIYSQGYRITLRWKNIIDKNIL